jgi:hypothetical protein
VFGDAPVISPWEFRKRMPPEPRIVPVPPRPLPETLRPNDLVPIDRPASDYAAIAWGLIFIAGIPMFLFRHWKEWRNRRTRG